MEVYFVVQIQQEICNSKYLHCETSIQDDDSKNMTYIISHFLPWTLINCQSGPHEKKSEHSECHRQFVTWKNFSLKCTIQKESISIHKAERICGKPWDRGFPPYNVYHMQRELFSEMSLCVRQWDCLPMCSLLHFIWGCWTMTLVLKKRFLI